MLDENLSQFRERLPIDLGKLDQCCAEQPELYADLGNIVTVLKGASKRAKSDLDLIKARVDRKIRSNPSAYVTAKPTETAIKSAIDTDDEVVAQQEVLLSAEQDYAAAQTLLDAFEQRRSMLRAAVALWQSKWFGSADMHRAGEDKELFDALHKHRQESNKRRTRHPEDPDPDDLEAEDRRLN